MYDEENGLVIDLTEAMDLTKIANKDKEELDKMFQEAHDLTLPEEVVLERGELDGE